MAVRARMGLSRASTNRKTKAKGASSRVIRLLAPKLCWVVARPDRISRRAATGSCSSRAYWPRTLLSKTASPSAASARAHSHWAMRRRAERRASSKTTAMMAPTVRVSRVLSMPRAR
jgi:hypothetical protein